MTYLPDADYFVRWIPFPPNNGTYGGMVMPNDDGTFSIYLDERFLGQPKMKKTYRHEEKHILDDDFDSGKPIAQIEDI